MTLTEARKEVWRFLQPINDVEECTEHTGKTMGQLITRWREAVKPAFKLSTQLSYEWALKRVSAVFAKSPLAAISKAEVQAFLTTAGRALSSESVRDLRARLRGVLSVAEEWGWIRPGANPARGKLRLPPRELARPRRVLSPVEFQRLLIALRQPYGTIVLLAVLSGLRRGELAALRWGDIRRGEIVIDEAVYNGQLGSRDQ
jgi:integrase